MGEEKPFTEAMISDELGKLRRLFGMLESERIESRERFTDLLRAAFALCGLSPRKLADDLGYSFSTVHRWTEARTSPHPSLWPTVTEWVSRSLLERIDELERSDRSKSA